MRGRIKGNKRNGVSSAKPEGPEEPQLPFGNEVSRGPSN